MRYSDIERYQKDVETAIGHTVGFTDFYHKRVLILGASGLLGSFMVDCLLCANKLYNAEITIYAVSRSREQLYRRFGSDHEKYLHLLEADVMTMEIPLSFDYIIHAAGYGYPGAFREIPAEVLLSGVVGAQRTLELARQSVGCRVLFLSSGEVQEAIDHLSVRACYPIGKMAAETLCLCYQKEFGVDAVIARPCHTFGANAAKYDNRATAQFLAAAAKGASIRMYSAGEQRRSFLYVADCVSGLLTILTRGAGGAVYGISSGESCTIREFAERCAAVGKCTVEFHMPTSIERSEASPIKKQIVNNDALRELGWQPAFSIAEGIQRTVEIIRQMEGN